MSAAKTRALLARYPELAAVLAAAIVGLSVQRPLAWLAARQGISVLLAVLVFATAVTIEPAALRRVPLAWRPLLAALIAGVTVLPALSWAASRLVPAGSLRDGVLAAGLAPSEIASVATTAMAGGEAAVAAGALIGSTVAAVALAGPILSLEAGRAGFSSGAIAVNLALVVALPLAAGIALPVAARALATRRDRAAAYRATAGAEPAAATPSWMPRVERAASLTAIVAVAALVALIAAEVHLSAGYVAVAAALVVFLLASALIGWLLGRRAPRPVAAAVLLTTSMRDFAIAAGLATAAFGPSAAAPLGLYGILVLIWGTAAAATLRHRPPRTECQNPPLPSQKACIQTRIKPGD